MRWVPSLRCLGLNLAVSNIFINRLSGYVQERGLTGLIRALCNLALRTPSYLIAIFVFLVHLLIGVLMLPVRRLVLGRVIAERIGDFALGMEVFLRVRWLHQTSGGSRPDFVVLVSSNPANEQLFAMYSREVTILRLPRFPPILQLTLDLWKTSPFFDPLEKWGNDEYAEFQSATPRLRFLPEEMAEGRRKLAKLGIELDRNWFVCIFARDSNYLSAVRPGNDWSHHNYRDCDVNTYHLAIAEIVSRGGFVVRMGSHAKAPLHFTHERVIDYALECRSDFMDVFLSAHCHFFMGPQSGIEVVATIFDRPRLSVNTVPFGHAPIAKHSLFIPKLLCSTTTGERYTFGRLLREFSDPANDPKVLNGTLAQRQGYRYLDNTPEEILEVTREMLDQLQNCSRSTAEDDELQRTYVSLVPKKHWCSAVKTPIGAGFLRRHRELLTP